MALHEYRKKRDPARTNEPFGPDPSGAGPTLGGAYVVHLHHATRVHYDLRLEVAGVLTSFAIPRGPTLDPAQKHLAVNTEDHPIEYLDFEAVIPDGQYGAGPMILWDRGRVRYLEGPAEDGLRTGKLDLELSGYKLHGRFALVRLKGSKNEWLFFKKTDAWSSATRDLIAEQPRSVLSGLTVDELRDAPGIAARLAEHAAEVGAKRGAVDPRKMVPMLCAAEGAPDHGEGWLYELKIDGVRVMAQKAGRAATLVNRRGRDETARYPEVTRAVSALAAEGAVLDGEIVAFDDAGNPSFQKLGRRLHLDRPIEVRRAMGDVPVVYVVFDLLALGDRDLRSLPLLHRKRLLRELLPGPGVMRVLDHLEGDGRPLLEFCRERRLEGVVAKRASSPYRAGPKRSSDWVKMKCERDDEFVVVGWTVGERGRGRLGALDIASFRGDELVLRGKVGSGLDEAAIDTLLARMASLVVKEAPEITGKWGTAPRGRTFVRPELVVSVRFLGWSDDANVRFPVFRGIRDDKTARECIAGPHFEREAMPAASPGQASDDAPSAAGPPSSARDSLRHVALTNRTKLLWPDEGYAKQDLWDYYRSIAPVILPYLDERPIILVRYPDGIRGKFFFQWNVPLGMPDWVRTLTIRHAEDNREVNVFLIDTVEALLYLANLACIPIHILGSRADTIDHCDFFTVDFDVKNASLPEAVELAHTLRELLDEIRLEGFPKTSGQTGLHVLVPLGPGIGFATGRGLADVLGRLVCHRHPKTATMERSVPRRGPRVYVDTGQTGPSRAIVAPYSVRATAGARVSTPLHWHELTAGLDPGAFTIRTVPARVAETGDPMAAMLASRPDVPGAVTRLEALSRKLGAR